MSAEAIAKALGGHRAGRDWMAKCPAHADRTPSLAIREGRDGKILVRCHAGCAQWEVISVLKDRGIWTPGGRVSPIVPTVRDDGVDSNRDRSALALKIWDQSVEAAGTPVEAYLRSRGLVNSPPSSLRFHPALKHPSGGTWPAMVGLVTSGLGAKPIGIHRTFLAHDGSAKAPVTPAKMMLGPCRGGVVRLADVGDSIMVGEGIETCLAAMQAIGRPAWAALSTSGLRALDLPDNVIDVVLLADGDDPGEAAAQAAARRLAREGRTVRIARPPKGKDFNDLLVCKPSVKP